MRVNRPDGTVRDEVVIVGGSGQAVGMNGDRLKVDANLNVDEVTVSNVGITSVDGAGMEQAGEYMPVKGEVQLTGSIPQKQSEIETIINAQTITPGGNTGYVEIDTKGAKKMIVAITSSRAWRMYVNTLWANVSHNSTHLFPNRSSSDQAATVSGNYPDETVVGLYLGGGGTPPGTMLEALNKSIVPANLRILVSNRDAENTMTLTMKVMRIWEV